MRRAIYDRTRLLHYSSISKVAGEVFLPNCKENTCVPMCQWMLGVAYVNDGNGYVGKIYIYIYTDSSFVTPDPRFALARARRLYKLLVSYDVVYAKKQLARIRHLRPERVAHQSHRHPRGFSPPPPPPPPPFLHSSPPPNLLAVSTCWLVARKTRATQLRYAMLG